MRPANPAGIPCMNYGSDCHALLLTACMIVWVDVFTLKGPLTNYNWTLVKLGSAAVLRKVHITSLCVL